MFSCTALRLPGFVDLERWSGVLAKPFSGMLHSTSASPTWFQPLAHELRMIDSELGMWNRGSVIAFGGSRYFTGGMRQSILRDAQHAGSCQGEYFNDMLELQLPSCKHGPRTCFFSVAAGDHWHCIFFGPGQKQRCLAKVVGR